MSSSSSGSTKSGSDSETESWVPSPKRRGQQKRVPQEPIPGDQRYRFGQGYGRGRQINPTIPPILLEPPLENITVAVVPPPSSAPIQPLGIVECQTCGPNFGSTPNPIPPSLPLPIPSNPSNPSRTLTISYTPTLTVRPSSFNASTSPNIISRITPSYQTVQGSCLVRSATSYQGSVTLELSLPPGFNPPRYTFLPLLTASFSGITADKLATYLVGSEEMVLEGNLLRIICQVNAPGVWSLNIRYLYTILATTS